MSSDLPLVSAVITTYNRREFVSEAVESALRQTYARMEVVVVDDGSDDGTVEMLERRFGEKIRVIRQQNAGVGAARNRGVEEARGEFVGFLDDDDVWLPEKISRQVEVFRRYGEETAVVGGSTYYIDEKGDRILRPTFADPVVTYERLCVFTAMPGTCSNELVRRSVMLDCGGFDPTLRRAQDRDLWIRIARDHVIRAVQEPTLLKRVHSAQRPGVDFDVIQRSRRRVNERIPERSLRRKAEAVLYQALAHRCGVAGKPLPALVYFLRSIVTYPGHLDRQVLRWRWLAEFVLPPGIHRILGNALRRVRGWRGAGEAS